MALCTPEELSRRLALRKGDFRWRGESVDPSTHPEFAPTLISWGSWLYQAAFDPETAETMIASPDLNGEDCHVFWHMATSAEDLLQNLKAAQLLAERSPLSGYASIGRDELQALMVATRRRRQAQRHDLPRARRRLRPPLPARPDHGGGGGHRRQGRPQQAPGRAGRPRHVPARGRAAKRRHRRARSQGAHVGLRRRGGADRDPDARHAQGGRRLHGRVRDPGRHARDHHGRARVQRRQRQRMGGADLLPRRARRDVHRLQRRLRAARADLPERRVAARGRRRQPLRERQPPGLPRHRVGEAPPLHRRRGADRRAQRHRGHRPHPREDRAHDQDGALDLGARRRRLRRELLARRLSDPRSGAHERRARSPAWSAISRPRGCCSRSPAAPSRRRPWRPI